MAKDIIEIILGPLEITTTDCSFLKTHRVKATRTHMDSILALQ